MTNPVLSETESVEIDNESKDLGELLQVHPPTLYGLLLGDPDTTTQAIRVLELIQSQCYIVEEGTEDLLFDYELYSANLESVVSCLLRDLLILVSADYKQVMYVNGPTNPVHQKLQSQKFLTYQFRKFFFWYLLRNGADAVQDNMIESYCNLTNASELQQARQLYEEIPDYLADSFAEWFEIQQEYFNGK